VVEYASLSEEEGFSIAGSGISGVRISDISLFTKITIHYDRSEL